METKMKISKDKNGSKMKLCIEGRLDTSTSPKLEEMIKTELDGITDLILDFSDLDYISSAGLRVVLTAQKLMTKRGKLEIRHVSDLVMEVFEVTGFADILTIKN